MVLLILILTLFKTPKKYKTLCWALFLGQEIKKHKNLNKHVFGAINMHTDVEEKKFLKIKNVQNLT